MNNTVENDFFGFPKAKWLHLTGEVDKSVRFSCHIFSGFITPKIAKNRLIFDRVIRKIKGGRFWDTTNHSAIEPPIEHR